MPYPISLSGKADSSPQRMFEYQWCKDSEFSRHRQTQSAESSSHPIYLNVRDRHSHYKPPLSLIHAATLTTHPSASETTSKGCI